MPTTTLGSDFTVKINGSAISQDWQLQIDSIEVDDALYMPSMCVMRFFDPQFAMIDSSNVSIGAAIEISVGEQRIGDTAADTGTIFKGEITSLEPIYERQFDALVIRAYDKAHRMMRTRNTKTFLNVTFSDVISELASGSGLSADVTATTAQHKYLVQDNQTDYEFAQSLARQMGFILRVDDAKLVFKSASTVKTAEVGATFVNNGNLLTFRPRLTSTGQWNTVKVRGWDVATKQAIAGEGSAETAEVVNELSTDGPATAQTAFGENTWLLERAGPVDQSEAQALAKALNTHSARGYAQAEGEIMGNPNVKAGTVINVTNVGTKFSGKYFVARAIHRFDQVNGYRTFFEADNGDGATIADLVLRGVGENDLTRVATKRLGLTIGVVTNNKDPDEFGRVKVKLPILDDNIESDWARLASPMAGGTRGLLFLPEVNDEVVVAFEDGDPSRPFVLGALWNGTDLTPETAANAVEGNGQVKLRVFKTRTGHMVTFDDTDNAGKVTIKTVKGLKIEFDDASSGKITVADGNGTNKVEIDVTGNKITVESGTEIDLKSQTIKLTATNIQVSADAQLELKGGATLKASGPQVEVNGSGQLALKGGMVMIN